MNKVAWQHLIESVIAFDFQAICTMEDGTLIGYEALLRNYREAGFASIDDFFNHAYETGRLVEVELMLRKKAIRIFDTINPCRTLKLFYNIDNRILFDANYQSGETSKFLIAHGLPLETIVFELSEKHHIVQPLEIIRLVENYGSQGFTIAIDDFGTGYSGLKLLCECKPQIIKLDRFFICDIAQDSSKFIVAKHLVAFAKELGIRTVAEGVETQAEFDISHALGFDYVQGYFIHRPCRSESLL